MDWSGSSPVPDGKTVPHTLTPEEIRSRQRRERPLGGWRLRVWRIAFVACGVLVPLLIIIGSVKHH